LTRFFHRKIINPVKQVGAACTSVTNGDFSVKVDIPNKDEIEEVVEYLNKVLSFQTEIIQNNGGDVDKYVGDAVLYCMTVFL